MSKTVGLLQKEVLAPYLNNYRVGKLKKLVLVLRFVPKYGKPADTLDGGGKSRFKRKGGQGRTMA